MKYVFRVDSSIYIGIGHLMRCLTISNTIKKTGSECIFICRELSGSSHYLIQKSGFQICLLPVADDSFYNWLGVKEEVDAIQTQEVISKLDLDQFVLFVDSYSLSEKWERRFKELASKILIIDDLVNRNHNCDFLIDQTYGREAVEYRDLVKGSALFMCGADYVMLRPEFTRLRASAIRKREKFQEINSILISMGGMDFSNFSLEVLTFFQKNYSNRFNLKVLLSSNAPHKQNIIDFIKSSEMDIELFVDVEDVAELLLNIDLVIGASGSSNWERCCLGVPSILTSTADNQNEILHEMAKSGAIYTFVLEDLNNGSFQKTLEKSQIESNYLKLVKRSSEVCDGLGLGRILQEVIPVFSKHKHKVSLRLVDKEDSSLIYKWQSHKSTRLYARNSKVPSEIEHEQWIKEKINDSSSFYFMIHEEDERVGNVRLDYIKTNSFEISININPEKYGQGIANCALKLVEYFFTGIIICATVLKENKASQRLFEKAGYSKISSEEFEKKI